MGGIQTTPTNSREFEKQTAECAEKHAGVTLDYGYSYCNATYDGYLCWPPTQAGAVVEQNCPTERLSDTSSHAFRKCSEEGLWVGRRPNETSPFGWTNFTPCFPVEVQHLLNLVYDNDDQSTQTKFDIASSTRLMEIIGFSISLIAICVSLIIYTQYRCLRNTRTRVHCSLFSAMLLQVIIRLILYGDQALVRSYQEISGKSVKQGIDNMPYLCESSYISLEYATSVMFTWMLIEGLYLHQVVTTNFLRGEIHFKYYYIIGWGLPVVFTSAWATLTAINYGQRKNRIECWYGYNFHRLYWILQAPRLGVILINFVFLINIMRVLIVKLRHTTTSELVRVRKAVRAALVLLPLLGITNILSMVEGYATSHGIVVFQIWSYVTHFLRSFQGFFIAVIYCFLNEEVKQAVKKHYRNYMAMRSDARRQQRTARACKDFASPQDPGDDIPGCSDETKSWVALRNMRYNSYDCPVANIRQSETAFGAEISTE
ncbi:hypothetical protein O3G_MSEX002721 [Manduca sexta]|uniref:PDF receptor n=1 Tax=Manduca sexta TaxID=7130 RepID=A0A921YQB4_MANSE|nr:hypothetical protein O3G_MSEX002721 [Manduca sexta]